MSDNKFNVKNDGFFKNGFSVQSLKANKSTLLAIKSFALLIKFFSNAQCKAALPELSVKLR